MTITAKIEAWQALVERTSTYDFGLGGLTTPLLTEDQGRLEDLWKVKTIVDRLATSKTQLFTLKTARDSAQIGVQATPIGEEFLQVLRIAPAYAIRRHFHLFRIHPFIESYLTHVGRRDISGPRQSGHPMTEHSAALLMDALNGAVEAIRGEVTTQKFKLRANNERMAVDAQCQKLESYFTKSLKQCAEPSVVRMVFSYACIASSVDQSTPEAFARCRSHGAELLSTALLQLGSALVGYAWRQDYGVGRGHQFHVVLLLNGPALQEVPSITKMLGEDWTGRITDNLGICYACHPLRVASFQESGELSSMKDPRQVLAQKEIKRAALFLTEMERLIRLDSPDRVELLGMGCLPKLGGRWPVQAMPPQPCNQMPPLGSPVLGSLPPPPGHEGWSRWR